MRHVTLRQLRAVAAIQSTGKIVNAAKVLGLTPPALTLQLKQAEEAAGLALFERASQGMRLTDAGRAFVDAAHAIEERLRLLSDEIAAIRGVKRGSLVLGVVSTAKYFAPRLIAGFMRAYPDITLRLVVGNRAETIAHLANYRVDVALMGRPPNDVPVQAKMFGPHPHIIIAAPGHPLAAHRRISKQRIAKEHFIIRERGSGTRISFERFLGELPGRLDDPGTEMESNETIKQAVMAGLGVAFISSHTVASEIETGRLVVLDVAGLPIMREWYSVVRGDRTVTPAVAAFLDFLSRHGGAHLPVLPALASGARRPGPKKPVRRRRARTGALRS